MIGPTFGTTNKDNKHEEIYEEILDVVHGCRHTDLGFGTGRDDAAAPACGGTALGG